MIRVPSFASLIVASTILSPTQCGSPDRSADVVGKEPPYLGPSIGASKDSLLTNPAAINPCGLFPAYSVPRMLGALDGPMWLARSMSDTTLAAHDVPQTPHEACMVRLAPRPGVPPGSIVAFEVRTDDAIAFETGAAYMNRAAKNMLDLIGAKTADGARRYVHGWDYLGAYPREMTGRVGHIAIHVDWQGVAVSLDSLEKLMVLMRDAIPDRPFEAFGPGSEAGEEDPCSLITREEAGNVLSTLAAPPYESRDLSGLADKNGTGCSYFFQHHKVVSIRPWWSNGRAVFNVIGATRPTGLDSYGAATRERPWDKEGADPVGNFYFLKGDKLLGLSWKTSDLSEFGAYKFALFAMKRLAK